MSKIHIFVLKLPSGRTDSFSLDSLDALNFPGHFKSLMNQLRNKLGAKKLKDTKEGWLLIFVGWCIFPSMILPSISY